MSTDDNYFDRVHSSLIADQVCVPHLLSVGHNLGAMGLRLIGPTEFYLGSVFWQDSSES